MICPTPRTARGVLAGLVAAVVLTLHAVDVRALGTAEPKIGEQQAGEVKLGEVDAFLVKSLETVERYLEDWKWSAIRNALGGARAVSFRKPARVHRHPSRSDTGAVNLGCRRNETKACPDGG